MVSSNATWPPSDGWMGSLTFSVYQGNLISSLVAQSIASLSVYHQTQNDILPLSASPTLSLEVGEAIQEVQELLMTASSTVEFGSCLVKFTDPSLTAIILPSVTA